MYIHNNLYCPMWADDWLIEKKIWKCVTKKKQQMSESNIIEILRYLVKERTLPTYVSLWTHLNN